MNNQFNLIRDKINSYVAQGCEEYLKNQSFLRVFPNHFTNVTGACENVNTLYEVNYDRPEKVFLSQSAQLRLEALTHNHGKVYCWLTSFRKETDADGRHLTEFPLLELERKGNLDDLLNDIELTIKSGIDFALKHCEQDFEKIGRKIQDLKYFKIDRVTYEKAIEFLNKNGYPDLKFGDDLKHEHELKIADNFGAIFITHYPKEIKFFNMENNNEDPRVVNSADLILPFSGESAGCASRQTEPEIIKEKLVNSDMYRILVEQLGLSIKDFHWYIDFHKENNVEPHAGTGIGFARVMQYILGQSDIRPSITYPTDAKTVW